MFVSLLPQGKPDGSGLLVRKGGRWTALAVPNGEMPLLPMALKHQHHVFDYWDALHSLLLSSLDCRLYEVWLRMLRVSWRFNLTSTFRPSRSLDASDVAASFPKEGILSKRVSKKMRKREQEVEDCWCDTGVGNENEDLDDNFPYTRSV